MTRNSLARRGVCFLAFLMLGTTLGFAQSTREPIDPRMFGMDIPAGKIKPGQDECVTTIDTDGVATVGKVHVNVGDYKIVLMPDGQLAPRPAKDAPTTDRPFEPMAKEKLVQKLTSGEFKNFKSKTTKNYIYLYTSSEEFAFGTGRILESMLPGLIKYAQAQKIPTHDPEVPLVVIMFRTQEDFQRYRRVPDGVVAYYDPMNNRVVMFEQSDAFGERPDIAVQQAISTIAHEGTHQILHNIGVQQRLSLWPMWLSEGIAEYLAPTEFSKKMTWKGAGVVNDMRMFELEQYVKSKAAAEANGDTVKHTVVASRLTSTGYAAAWSLTHYLATKRKADFNKYMAEIAKLGPFEGHYAMKSPVVHANAPVFEKYFGADYVDLEKKLITHLVKQPYNDPFAREPHFAATLIWVEGKKERRDASTYHSPALADKWLKDKIAKIDGPQPKSEIKIFPNRPLAEAYAKAWLRGRD